MVETNNKISIKQSSNFGHNIQPFQNGLGFAVKYSAGIDSTVATLNFYLRIESSDGATVTYQQLTTQACSSTNFPYNNWSASTATLLDGYYCLSASNHSIGITSNSANYNASATRTSLSIYLNRCSGASCKSDNEIITAVRNSEFQMVTIESYYDPSSSLTPIKQYLNDKWRFPVSPYYFTRVSMDITPNLVHYVNETIEEFYSTSMLFEGKYDGYSDVFGEISFETDLSYNNYIKTEICQSGARRNLDKTTTKEVEREPIIDRLLLTLSHLGGMYVVLYAVFHLIVYCCTKSSLEKSFASRLNYMNDILAVDQRASRRHHLGNANFMDPPQIEEEKHDYLGHQLNNELKNSHNPGLFNHNNME